MFGSLRRGRGAGGGAQHTTRRTIMRQFDGSGTSKSWELGKENHVRLFELYRTHGAKAASPPEPPVVAKPLRDCNKTKNLIVALCRKETFDGFATWLTKVYKQKEGKPLKWSTINNCLSATINEAARLRSEASGANLLDATTKAQLELFFTCLQPGSTTNSAVWLRGLKKSVLRWGFEQCKLSGELGDDSEVPIYLEHVKKMCRAYAIADTPEAAVRKLTIKMLIQAAGRTSEVAWLTTSGMSWDDHFHCVVVAVPQSKVSKVKFIAFCAGVDRHSDFFVDLGDKLALEKRPIFDEDDVAWLVPELQYTENPGATVGSFVKHMLPGESVKYATVAVKELPPGASAGGFRPGACNMLSEVMPNDLVVATTGHDLDAVSALYRYIDAKIANIMPGAVVLSGWRAFAWGHRGPGPVPPSLTPIIDCGVSLDLLDIIIDDLYELDGTAPPPWRIGGSLRKAVYAAFASQVMYFEERNTAGEMRSVAVKMKNAIASPKHGVCSVVDVEATIARWGRAVKAKFDVDNLHLTAKASHGAMAVFVQAIKDLAAQVGNVSAQVRDSRCDSAAAQQQTMGWFAQLMKLWSRTAAADNEDPTKTETVPTNTGPTDTEKSDDTEHHVNTSVGGGERGGVGGGGKPGRMGLSADNANLEVETLAGKFAPDFFLRVTRHGMPQMSKQNVNLTNQLLGWFNGVATAEEKEVLTARVEDREALKRTVAHVQVLVKERLAEAYVGAGWTPDNLPAILKPRKRNKPLKDMAAGGLETHISALNKQGVSVEVDTLNAWRVARDESLRGTKRAAEADEDGEANKRRASPSSSLGGRLLHMWRSSPKK